MSFESGFVFVGMREPNLNLEPSTPTTNPEPHTRNCKNPKYFLNGVGFGVWEP